MFIGLTGCAAQVVSTFDHPFPSAPLFLFDGHTYLCDEFGANVVCMNWDVAHPNARRYKYDLIVDTGLVAKLPALYQYEPDIPYSSQHPRLDAVSRAQECIEVAVVALERRRSLSKNVSDAVAERAHTIVDLAKQALMSSDVPWRYSSKLLASQYSLVGHPDLAEWLLRQSIGYRDSKWCREWIPWCIEEVAGELSFDALRSSGLFVGNIFRGIDDNVSASEAAKAIRDGTAIPGLHTFLWSAALAGIRHYGNDRGLFERLSAIDPSVGELQLTMPGADCYRFAELTEDYAVGLDYDPGTGPTVSQRKFLPSKSTRLTTLSGSYVLGGDPMIALLTEYRSSTAKRSRTGVDSASIGLVS